MNGHTSSNMNLLRDEQVSPTSQLESSSRGSRDLQGTQISESSSLTRDPAEHSAIVAPHSPAHSSSRGGEAMGMPVSTGRGDDPVVTSPRSVQVDRRRGCFVSPPHAKLYPPTEEPSFTFVCLGVGGGPIEGDCSCYIMKPAQRKWQEGSIVVEGGSWLGALSRVCEDEGPDSAFCDVDFPFDVPALRAGYLGSFAHSFLLSHAHLDHILGMVLGSASLPGRRKVYGLKNSLDNLMGVFNGKVWPQLAAWGDAPGPAVYQLHAVTSQHKLRVDDSLTIVPFALSHGLNPSEPPAPPTPAAVVSPRYSISKRLSLPMNGYFSEQSSSHAPSDRPAIGERPIFTSPFAPESSATSSFAKRNSALSVATEDPSSGDTSPRASTSGSSSTIRETSGLVAEKVPAGRPGGSKSSAPPRTRRPRTAQGSETDILEGRAASVAGPLMASSQNRAPAPAKLTLEHGVSALDSTAFFITNDATGKDVLFFGDVEPDSVSQKPRNGPIWAHAARQFAAGKLNAVFLECSFPASHPTEFLYGHLSVAHVFDELRVMAKGVVAERKRMNARRRRQREANGHNGAQGHAPSNGTAYDAVQNAENLGAFKKQPLLDIPALHSGESTITDEELNASLQNLSVIIIHVKTALFPSFEAKDPKTQKDGAVSSLPDIDERIMDPRSMRDRIYDELKEAEEAHGFGVRFVMAQQGLRIEC